MNLHLSVTIGRSHAPIVKFPRDIQRARSSPITITPAFRFDLSKADAPARRDATRRDAVL